MTTHGFAGCAAVTLSVGGTLWLQTFLQWRSNGDGRFCVLAGFSRVAVHDAHTNALLTTFCDSPAPAHDTWDCYSMAITQSDEVVVLCDNSEDLLQCDMRVYTLSGTLRWNREFQVDTNGWLQFVVAQDACVHLMHSITSYLPMRIEVWS
jgi:hypothetical protein